MMFYDAFAGIGGFRLGLERAGFKCVGSCEIDDYARKVYHKNFGEWPDGDIREVTDINGADMLCGGFPCQDISLAGKGAGLSGEESGLWWELARLIENCLPRYVLLENVPALAHRGFGDILFVLASSGYDAEWDCIPAKAFGAPHQRDRIWIVAHSNGDGLREKQIKQPKCKSPSKPNYNGEDEFLANTEGDKGRFGNGSGQENGSYWAIEPNVGRVANGVPNRVDRLKCLGNAVVPQVVEWIGRRILEIEKDR